MGMQPIQPTKSYFLVKCAPGDLQPYLVKEDALFCLVGNPKQYRCRINQGTKFLLIADRLLQKLMARRYDAQRSHQVDCAQIRQLQPLAGAGCQCYRDTTISLITTIQ